MKRIIVAGLALLALVEVGRAQEEKFSRSLAPDDFSAAGLDLLSTEQRSRLDALIATFMGRARPAASRPAEAAPLAIPVAKAEKTGAPEAKPAKIEAVEPKAARPGFLAKAKSKLQSDVKNGETKTSDVILESTIPGKFRGWEGRAVLVLANGQRWQVANGESYYTPAVENPRVQILPAAVMGHWLRFPDLDVQIRVNLVGEK